MLGWQKTINVALYFAQDLDDLVRGGGVPGPGAGKVVDNCLSLLLDYDEARAIGFERALLN